MTATVIVPLDGSTNAEQAIPYGLAIARRRHARLLLVSIVDIPIEFGAWTTASATAMGHELDQWIADSEAYLRRIAGEISVVPVDTVVRMGSAAREICMLVHEHAADDPVVAMSSHGRTGARRIVIGSVASRVVHDAGCPVLVVRRSDAAAVEPRFERILVPLDGSDFSEAALARVAAVLGTPLQFHLVRVIESSVIPASAFYEPGMPVQYGLVGEYLAAAREEATIYLQDKADALTAAGHDVSWEVRDGRVAGEIITAASEHEIDVIAMATHGRGGIGRLVFGSVAEGVLHQTTVPLLLARPG